MLTNTKKIDMKKIREDQPRGTILNIPGSFLSVGAHLEKRLILTKCQNVKT